MAPSDESSGILSTGLSLSRPSVPKRRTIGSVGLVLLILIAGCTGSMLEGIGRPTVDNVRQDVPETHPNGSLSASEVRELERIVFNMTNHERGRRGLEDLEWSTELARVNDYHAWDMWNRDYFSHDEPDGDGPENRIEQFGYSCPGEIGEIQASNVILEDESLDETAAELILSWMNSEAHRSAILNDAYEVAGVGIYVDETDTVYAVIVFCEEVVTRPADVRGTNETVPRPPNETAAKRTDRPSTDTVSDGTD